VVHTSACSSSRTCSDRPKTLEEGIEAIQPDGIEALAAFHVEDEGLVVLGLGDGGCQVVGGGQSRFVGGTVDE